MTTVGEMCERDVVVVTPEMTVSEAANLMRSRHVGSLVVVSNMNGGLRTPVSIVTDRDLVVEVTAVDLDPKAITIGDIMASRLFTVRADEGPLEAIHTMRSKGVRRLPVVNDQGRLLGIVTFDDLLAVIAGELGALTKVVNFEQSREATTRK